MTSLRAGILTRAPALWLERFSVVGRAASRHRRRVGLVGGCVRDLLLDRSPLDWDIMTDGPLDPLIAACRKSFSVKEVVEYPRFLTATLHFSDGTSLDLARSRKERYAHPGALPEVEPTSWDEDFKRRDFAVNAMSLDLLTARWGQLMDPFGGAKDLSQGVLRVLHEKSFIDDPTRIYRAARYAGRYHWEVDKTTRDLVGEAVAAEMPARVSPARRKSELEHLLREPEAEPALRRLWDWGVWSFWSPHWQWTPPLGRAFRAVETVEVVFFRLLALGVFGGGVEWEADVKRLGFPNQWVRATLDAVHRVHGKSLPEEGLPPLSPPLHLARQEFFNFCSREGGVPGFSWNAAEPLLTGEDLKQLGLTPGPVFQEILHRLRDLKRQGRLTTRAQETQFVVDNFRAKNT